MLPGKKYKPEDLLQSSTVDSGCCSCRLPSSRRRRRSSCASCRIAYMSQATILSCRSACPSRYVKSTGRSTRIAGSAAARSAADLSRTRLERSSRSSTSTPTSARNGIMEDIVAADARQRHRDRTSARATSFTVAYFGDDPRTVQRVTERLAALFIEENCATAIGAGRQARTSSSRSTSKTRGAGWPSTRRSSRSTGRRTRASCRRSSTRTCRDAADDDADSADQPVAQRRIANSGCSLEQQLKELRERCAAADPGLGDIHAGHTGCAGARHGRHGRACSSSSRNSSSCS